LGLQGPMCDEVACWPRPSHQYCPRDCGVLNLVVSMQTGMLSKLPVQAGSRQPHPRTWQGVLVRSLGRDSLRIRPYGRALLQPYGEDRMVKVSLSRGLCMTTSRWETRCKTPDGLKRLRILGDAPPWVNREVNLPSPLLVMRGWKVASGPRLRLRRGRNPRWKKSPCSSGVEEFILFHFVYGLVTSRNGAGPCEIG
jgi:hypothetical protein